MIFGKHINRYYFKYALYLLGGIAALAVVDYLQLAIPGIYQLLINGINDGYVEYHGVVTAFDINFLIERICMPLIGVISAIVICRFIWRICFIGTAIRVETDLRDRMFDNARWLSREYYQVNKVGSLMSLFTNDLDTIQDCFGFGTLMLADALLLGTLAIIKMARMNLLLALLTMIPMLLLLASATIVGRRLTQKWDVRQEAYSKLSDFAQESFSGIMVIKAFVKESKELLSFKKLNVENEKANVSFTRTEVLFRILVTLFVESVICIILGYGGYLVYSGTFNAGQLVEYIGYFTSVIWPIMAVSELIDMTSRGKASLDRVGTLLDAKPTVVDREGAVELPEIKGDIEFRGLSFRYPDGEFDSLTDLSFKINAGENVGLVGKTGSGKTTVVDLILRTYNVPDGTLFIDGHDVNDITIHSVRNGCAYVPQDNFLFSDTIESNIAFGVENYERKGIETAASMSDVDKDIKEFGKGYSTVLGERGVTVSGGQKQRISIARALMKDAPILILDDSISAVDTDTEKTILDNLKKTRTGKTTILIAHRITTVEKMDKIVFIDEGRVKAVGSHDELCELCPEYKHMVELQKLEEEGGAN